MANAVTSTGVSGTAEVINPASSGLPGQAQISVPGVALVTFTGVERLAAVGNIGSAGDEDPPAFTGTNAVDRFKINLAAAGRAADEVPQGVPDRHPTGLFGSTRSRGCPQPAHGLRAAGAGKPCRRPVPASPRPPEPVP